MIAMESSSCKRRRTENFSKSEEKHLVESVKKCTNIIECKKTDAVPNKDKNVAWTKIANCFNSNSKNYRTAEQLKTKYLNLKKQCKKIAEEKKLNMGTGGGPFLTPKTSTVDEDIGLILGSQVTGLQSNFDNDSDENVLDPGFQSTVMLESDNEDNIEYCELTGESTVSGILNEILCQIAPKSGMLKELIDNNYSNTGYEKLEEHDGSEDTDAFACDKNANSFHDGVETPISQHQSIHSEKAQNNYNTESQWKMLKKPISKVLKPNSEKNTISHEKPLLRTLQSQKSEADEKGKKRGRPDPLKQKLSKWAESKSNLVDLQKKYYEEEHKKRWNSLKKNALELQYMKQEHEGRMMKILGPK